MKFDKKVARIATNDAYDIKMGQLLMDDIAWKTERITGYHEALQKAYDNLDLSMEAKFLTKERQRLIKKGFTGEKISHKGRNIKIALLVGAGLYLAHEMGYFETAKVKYRRAQLWAAAMQDPESEVYKNFIDDMQNKVAAAINGGDPSDWQRYKNGRTVQGETVAETTEHTNDPQPPEAGGDADDFWPHPGN